jgi:DNA replication protein DnaC
MQALTTPTTTPKPPNSAFADWLGFRTFGDAELEKVVSASHEWAQAFKDGAAPRWLSLIGPSGTGKTHCGKRLWRWASSKANWSRCDYLPQVIYWPDFMQRLKSGNHYDLRNEIKRWPVLFLDDVGAERDPSGFAAEELNTLLGCRMDRWTLLTSNLGFESLKRVDGRIASRLIRSHNICVQVNTRDFSTR